MAGLNCIISFKTSAEQATHLQVLCPLLSTNMENWKNSYVKQINLPSVPLNKSVNAAILYVETTQ